MKSTFKQHLLLSEARTSSDVSPTISVGDMIEGLVFVNVSAVSGTTPNLKIYVKGSSDGTNFAVLDEFEDITAETTTSVRVSNFGKTLRLDYEISGDTPSFTFSADFIGKANT